MEEETGKFWQRDLQNVDAISKAGLDKSLAYFYWATGWWWTAEHGFQVTHCGYPQPGAGGQGVG